MTDPHPNGHRRSRSSPGTESRSARGERNGYSSGRPLITRSALMRTPGCLEAPGSDLPDDQKEQLTAVSDMADGRCKEEGGCVQRSGVRVRPDPGVCSGIGMVPA